MEWLLLAALCIMWVAFLIPVGRRGRSTRASVEDFGRRMELLAQAETHGTSGRWIVTPRKGMRFVGPEQRRRARIRQRRRRVLVLLLESWLITALIGIVPPLRPIWYLSAGIAVLLMLYVLLLLAIKNQARRPHQAAQTARPARPVTSDAVAPRWVAEGRGSHARPTVNGLGAVAEGDRVHVVVREAGEAASG